MRRRKIIDLPEAGGRRRAGSRHFVEEYDAHRATRSTKQPQVSLDAVEMAAMMAASKG
jgi:hypothetical protein